MEGFQQRRGRLVEDGSVIGIAQPEHPRGPEHPPDLSGTSIYVASARDDPFAPVAGVDAHLAAALVADVSPGAGGAVHASQANYNTEVGLPLAALEADDALADLVARADEAMYRERKQLRSAGA